MNLKKLLLCLSMFVVTASKASTTSSENYCLTNDSISTCIGFGVRYVDPTIPKDGPRSPVAPPSVSIDGHTLYLYSGCDGATLRVVDAAGEEVYIAEITDFFDSAQQPVIGIISLPETLLGDYELQILRGNFCFYATIEL